VGEGGNPTDPELVETVKLSLYLFLIEHLSLFIPLPKTIPARKKTKDGRRMRAPSGLPPQSAPVGPHRNRRPLGLDQRQRGVRVVEDVGISSVSLVTPPSTPTQPTLPVSRSEPVPTSARGDADADAPQLTLLLGPPLDPRYPASQNVPLLPLPPLHLPPLQLPLLQLPLLCLEMPPLLPPQV